MILIGRNSRKLEAVHTEIETAGGPEPIIALLDLEKALAKDYDQLADAVMERYGRLDGLLHNAGLLGAVSPIEHYDVPTWCRVMHVNVTAAFALTQVLLPALKRSADASVIFTASGVGRRGRAYWGAYAASKFALEGLSQVLSSELEGITAVRVNTLNPGKVRTMMRRTAYPAEDINTLPLPESITGPVRRIVGARHSRQSQDSSSTASRRSDGVDVLTGAPLPGTVLTHPGQNDALAQGRHA